MGAGGGSPTATVHSEQESTTHTSNNNRNLQQTRLYPTAFNPNEPWGNSLQNKQMNVIRIGFRNIRSLPISITEDKNQQLCDDIKSGQFDVFGMSEINLAWHRLSYESLPSRRFRSLLDTSKFVFGNNRHDLNCSNKQKGGTMIGIVDQTCHRVIRMGNDERNLGRWSWVLIQGSHSSLLLIVSVYRPCNTTGATTVYSQQQRVLLNAGIHNCPRTQFWLDLEQELQVWVKNHYSIVIGGDFNQYVGDSSIKNFFSKFEMREAIIGKHGTPCPGTHLKGSTPIDGIFCSASILVTQAGYTSVHWGLRTDHRVVWIDLCAEQALGKDAPPFIMPKARKLQLDQPQVVNQYLFHRLYMMSKNRLLDRTNDLFNKVVSGERSTNILVELERLDRIRTYDMLEAESRCRKLKTGQVEWSPDIQRSIAVIRYLRIVISYHNGNKINARTLHKAYNRTSLQEVVQDLDTAIIMLRTEKQTFQTIKGMASSKRQTFLEELADSKATQNGLDFKTVLDQLKLRERQRELARQLRRIKANYRQGLNEIHQYDDEQQLVIIRDKKSIERACIKEGHQRFVQAKDTPSLQQDQIDLLGWTGDSSASTEILNGGIPAELHSDLKKMAKFFQKPSTIAKLDDINCFPTLQEFTDGWKKAKEHTSSGKSGLHFGHFKADTLHEKTNQINHQLLHIILILGHSLLRWQHAIDVMIPKKANSKQVDKLRVICLMEADFNYMNKWMGRITMKHAENANSIAPEQFGSRKHKSAILHAFNKALCFDYFRLSKSDVSLAVLDAKSCYDRILPPLACVSLRQHGLPQSIINASFNTIKDMSHYVRTAFGTSTSSYDRGDGYMHGILQGNGAGPCIWVMLSTPILNMLKASGCGVNIPISSTDSFQVVGFAFVDDVDVIQSLPAEGDILSSIQYQLDTWKFGLNTCSGDLVWDKSDIYILRHLWNKNTNQWKLANNQQTPGNIFITTLGQRRAIRRKELNQATMSLGINFAPSGCMKDQVAHLRKKAEEWADLLRVKKVSRDGVWYSMNASILKTIEYPLLATTLSQQQFQYIMAPIFLSALPRAGICRYMNREVVYGSLKHQGLGIPNPFVTQGLKKLFEVLNEPCKANPTYLYLTTAINVFVVFSGLGPNFFSVKPNKKMLAIIDNSIIRSLWEFLHIYGIQLHCHTPDIKFFESDELLMAKVYQSEFHTKDIAIFNWCRLYLQISRLSEIISLDGRQIKHHIWNGIYISHVQSNTNWIRQPQPSQAAWNTFRKMLSILYQTNPNGIFTRKLAITNWNHTEWKWFYCTNEDRLYQRSGDKAFSIHCIALSSSRRSSRSNKRFYKSGTTVTELPNNVLPVTVFFQGDTIILDTIVELGRYYQTVETRQRWSDHLRVQNGGTNDQLKDAYLKGNLLLVSDGSFKESTGAAAWILTDKTTLSVFEKGQCFTTGDPSNQDSHRSELFGILGGMFFLRKHLKRWGNPQGIIQIGCDNTSALGYAFNQASYPVILASFPDFDVIQSIRSLTISSTTYTTTYIPGHQDKYMGPLDLLSTLNVQMDHEAKHMRQQANPSLTHALLTNQRYSLFLHTRYICQHLQTNIREGISEDIMRDYWSRKEFIPASKFHQIAWPELQIAMKKSQPTTRHWITKHATGLCGVNATLVNWKMKTCPNCKRCGGHEDAQHVWQCKHPSSATIWEQSLTELSLWMISENSSPYLTEALISGLRCWYSGLPLQSWCPLHQAQQQIGWQNIMFGRFHTIWTTTQADYFVLIRKKTSVSNWLARLIIRIWKIAWQLWLARDEWEHLNDEERMNREYSLQIEKEIAYGFESLPRKYWYMFTDREIVFLRTSARKDYKRQWLDNLEAVRFSQTSASINVRISSAAPMPI